MTDTSTQAPPPSDPSAFATSLNTVLNTAPELGKSPGLSVGIASAGGDVQGNSQATGRFTNILSDTNAHTAVSTAVGGSNELQSALDWFGNHVVADVGAVGHDVVQGAIDVGSKVLSTANKGMQVVQHEYRYLHQVEATHGPQAALLEGLGIAVGAGLGLAATGSFYGADLGAEGAAGLESQVFDKEAWAQTAKASYADPNTHQKVSIGRDITSELSSLGVPGLERGSVGFKITSGLIDGIFDMNVGGTEVLGLAGKANSAKGLGGALGDLFPGKAPQTTEAFDDLLNSFSGGNVRRAFEDIAGKSAGEIANSYRTLSKSNDFVTALSHASTGDEVAELFRSAIRSHELAFMEKLPTLSVGRLPFQAMHEYMGNSDVPGVQRLFRATTRLPTSWDDVEKLWTNKEFDPASKKDSGILGIFRSVLFTDNENTAAAVSQAYADANVPGKIKIWRDVQWSTLINMIGYHGYTRDEFLEAAFDDPAVRREWAHASDEAIAQGMFGKGAVYGTDGLHDISIVRDSETGTTFPAAITKNQTGSLQYMDLKKMRQAGRILGDRELMAKLGGADEWLYNSVTAGVFKPWVLATPSYAMHIAAAELIPNMLRLGPFKLIGAQVTRHFANLGMDTSDEEIHAIQGVVYKVLRRIPGLDINDRTVEYATDHILDNDGAQVPHATSSGHNYGEELVPRDVASESQLRRAFFDSGKTVQKLGDNFGMIADGSRQYEDAWQAELWEGARDDASRMAANRIIASAQSGETLDEATAKATKEVAQFLRSDEGKEAYEGFFQRGEENITSFLDPATSRPPDMDQYDEWATATVKKVLGGTVGKDGSLNVPLLSHIANGELADDDELSAADFAKRPYGVKGREMLPSAKAASMIGRFPDWMFRRALNPMVNFLSREPIDMAEYLKQRALLQDAVDNGHMTVEEAKVFAETRTAQKVIDNVHNLTDRTQWTETFRNWAPFYFAQEQAYRRMGRLLAEDPAAFRKYQLMITNMHDVGQVFSGKNGEGYLVMPGTGFLTKGVVSGLSMLGVKVDSATPVGMGWNLSSSSVIFPLSAGVRPDIGPLVSIAVSEAAQLFPETLSPVLKADLTADANTILGPTATEAWYEQMIPNTVVQRLLTAALPAFNARSFNSTMMQTLATLDYEGKIPPAGSNYRVMQAFVDRVQNQTRILYAMKALVGAVTPVSPELTNPTYNLFSAELSADITAKKSVAAGLQEFLTKHPEATPFTVWQSSELTGMSVPSSTAAENWVNNNYDLITRYPNAGILLMPTTGLSTKYNSAVYNEQIAQNLRSKLDPEQWTQDGSVPSYIDALYIAAGNSIFYKWLAQYEAQIKSLSGSDKYNADQAFWGNGTLGSGTIGKYAQQNPVWGNWFNSDSRETERGQAIIQMTKLLNENPGITSDIANNTRTLLQGYAAYQNQITTLTTDGSSSTMQTEAKDSWDNYLVSTATSDPEMINVITGLFMSIPTATAPQVNIANATPGAFTAKNWKTP